MIVRAPRGAKLRRLLCFSPVLAILPWLGIEPREEPADSERPTNVVLVSIDSLRADHLACYGYDRETSPHLDRLADEGVLFEQTVAESSWTLPTHHTMFTGLTSGAHGVTSDDVALAPGHITLAERFSAAGYRTHGVWSGIYLHPTFGFGQGFDDWVGVQRTALDAPDFDLDIEEQQRRRLVQSAHGSTHEVRSSEAVTEAALGFLAQKDARPFFLFVHYFDAHYDYIPPEEYWRRFDPDYDGDYTPEQFMTDPEVTRDMDARELEHVIARYDGEILWVDEHVGRLVAALEASGRAKDTLVAVTSDHGEEFFEHGYKGHFRTLFDEVLLVPLVVWQPGRVARGVRIPGQVRHVDIAPTLLDWAGLEVPDRMMGRSLVDRLRGEAGGDDLPAYSRLRGDDEPGLTSLRTRTWKLVVRRKRNGTIEARHFNLAVDPDERGAVDGMSQATAAWEELVRWKRFEKRTIAGLDLAEEPSDVSDPMRDELDGLGYTE